MSELKASFERAVAGVMELKTQPEQEDMLNLYALYKQATVGDVQGEAPGMFDFRAAAKYSAWERLKGLSAEKAMQRYINTVEYYQLQEA